RRLECTGRVTVTALGYGTLIHDSVTPSIVPCRLKARWSPNVRSTPRTPIHWPISWAVIPPLTRNRCSCFHFRWFPPQTIATVGSANGTQRTCCPTDSDNGTATSPLQYCRSPNALSAQPAPISIAAVPVASFSEKNGT